MLVKYRKTKKGDWVAFGPVAQMVQGQHVTIHKSDGSTERRLVDGKGKAFVVDGIECCYGYLAPRPGPARRRDRGGDSCGYPCPVDGHRCTPSNPCHDCL